MIDNFISYNVMLIDADAGVVLVVADMVSIFVGWVVFAGVFILYVV